MTFNRTIICVVISIYNRLLREQENLVLIPNGSYLYMKAG
jgi:hypothetical protein